MRFALPCLLTACWTSSSPPAVAPLREAPVAVAPGRVAVGVVPPAADDRKGWLRTPLVVHGDLDGWPGDERVIVTGTGTLTIGTRSTPITFDPTYSAVHDQYRLELVTLGPGRRGVLVTSPVDDFGDPPSRHRIYLYDRGEARLVFDRMLGVGVGDATRLVFARDGTVSYVESGWQACLRDAGHAEVATQRITFKLDAAGTALRMIRREPTSDVQDCDLLAE